MTEPNELLADSRLPQEHRDAEKGEPNMLDLMIILAKHKTALIALPILFAVATAIYSLLVTPVYTGTAKMLPPQQSQSSAAALLGQLGAIAQAGGGAGAMAFKQPNDLYVLMLKSRTVADRIIDRFKLHAVYKYEYLEDTRRALIGSTRISGKEPIITIEYDDSDPQRAADIANAYVEELHNLTQNLAVTEASQRRLFFEKQLKQAKDDLAGAEIALKSTQESTGVIKLDDQGRVIIEQIAQLRAQIVAREVQVASMSTFSSERNPDLLRVKEEIAGLRRELAKAEQGTGPRDGNIFVPTGKVPETGLAFVRRVRDVKYQETLFELLAKQFELAKIDEAKEGTLIQTLDRAVIPERRTSPKRRVMVMIALAAGLIVALFWALMAEVVERSRTNPAQREQWHRLHSLLRRQR